LLQVEVVPFQGRPSLIRAGGEYVSSDVRDAVTTELDKHQDWTEQRVLDYIEQHGAKFTPNSTADPGEVFLSRLRKLEAILGRISISQSVFEIFAEDSLVNGKRLTRLYWRIQLTATLADGRSAEYSARFEPFGGQLEELKQRQPYQQVSVHP
jgi:hypothetical protein